jgi:hypothetical protein
MATTTLSPEEILDREIQKELKRFPRRVKKGAKLLDRQHPGWADKVRITKLKMSDPRSCVLGEVFAERDPETGELSLYSVDGFSRGSEALGLDESDAQAEHGFDLDAEACFDIRERYRAACEKAGVRGKPVVGDAIDGLWKPLGDLWKAEIRQRREKKAAKA